MVRLRSETEEDRLISKTYMAGLLALMLAGAAAITATGSHAVAQPLTLAMLSRLTPGAWDIRLRPGNNIERICVRHGRDLVQLRHPRQPCGQFVVEDTADRVTVQYSCKGRGYGRTHIRWENNGLVHIESQGLVSGQPFSFSAEARHAGPCS